MLCTCIFKQVHIREDDFFALMALQVKLDLIWIYTNPWFDLPDKLSKQNYYRVWHYDFSTCLTHSCSPSLPAHFLNAANTL